MKERPFPNATTDFNKSNGLDHSFHCEGPSLTRQEFAEECDINTLMKKYEGHVIGGPGGLQPQDMYYADFSEQPRDLLSYMNLMDEAQTAFMTLPAIVRKEFDNDPMQFVMFAQDENNLDTMRQWGLAAPKKEEKPMKVEVINPPKEPPKDPPSAGSTHVPT